MLKKIKLLYQLMTPQDKRQLLLILLLSIINGLFNVIGIASILPFISIISEPELVETNAYLRTFVEFFGLQSYTSVVLTFAGISFCLVLLGNVLGGLDVWMSQRFGLMKELTLSHKLLSVYLHTDDVRFFGRKNSERTKNILADVDRVIIDTLFSMLDMLSNILVALFIFILLLVVSVQATLIISLGIIAVYLLVYLFTSNRLHSLGEEFADLETEIYSDVLDALNLQREIKLARKQSFFVDRYYRSFAQMARNRLKSELLSLVPQQVIEVVAFGSILVIATFFAVSAQSNLSAVTVIGMYAFAAYRLMPAVRDIFDGWEQIQFGSAVLRRLIREFSIADVPESRDELEPLQQFETLRLSNIHFQYPGSDESCLKNVSLQIEAGRFYCIMGKTGAGKSTLLNIIAGLYRPAEGETFLNNEAISLYDNSTWQRTVSYVPVRVNVMSDSLHGNIALGCADEDIDREKVLNIAKLVRLEDNLNLPASGYDTELGDGGLALSTGQTQKLGIARALYREPKVLLLDESTDALDLETESQVITNIRNAYPALTVVFISHRPSVRNFADEVVELETLLQEN